MYKFKPEGFLCVNFQCFMVKVPLYVQQSKLQISWFVGNKTKLMKEGNEHYNQLTISMFWQNNIIMR